MIRKLLIANRGEIARRIVRTCKRLGVSTVGIFSAVEHGHPHTLEVDEAVLLGADLRSSYLDIDRILQVATSHGVDAVHPGYGFLAENPEFAEQVIAAGLRFVGPTPETMRLFGHKHTARRIAREAGVPVAEGYDGDEQDEKYLQEEAQRIGFPLMIKAVAGGGGRGMRRVNRVEEFVSALQSAKREARGAFGDERVLLERVIEDGRHVEVQLLGDGRGTVLHFYERDCSVQRRYQKVIEECPAPGIDEALRTQICEAAVRLGQRVSLRNATTVEFLLVASGSFYFLEANTRLQVEHPVTEEVTGFDLVELQLRVASGNPLGVQQTEIKTQGHSIEARVYAENPFAGFVPTVGSVRELDLPEASNIRCESGISEGTQVSTNFDPMLLKVISRGGNRAEAIAVLDHALSEVKLAGVATNIQYLKGILQTPKFIAGDVTTKFLDQNPIPPPKEGAELSKVAVAALLFAHPHYTARCYGVSDFDPFTMRNFFRSYRAGNEHGFGLTSPPLTLAVNAVTLGTITQHQVRIVSGTITGPCQVEIAVEVDGIVLQVAGETYNSLSALPTCVAVNGERYRISATFTGVTRQSLEGAAIWLEGFEFQVVALEAVGANSASETASGEVRSPLPGVVLRVEVEPDTTVSEGAPLFILESMKMEHLIVAPSTCHIQSIEVGVGASVHSGQLLLRYG